MAQTFLSSAPDQRRVALFVDGENVPSSYAGRIIMQSLEYGQLAVRRVYGGVSRIPSWDEAPGFRMVHSGSGKNGADIMIAIQAVAMSFESRADVFVLVSSDGDFTLLAHHLRERGFTVIGIGVKKAPERFRKACHDFYDLSAAQPVPDEVTAQVEKAIEAYNRPMKIKLLGSRMGQSGIFISEYKEKKWRDYLESRPDLFRCEGKGQEACVTLAGKD